MLPDADFRILNHARLENSFGVLMYELWAGELLLITYINTSRAAALGIKAPPDFARRVRLGLGMGRAWAFTCVAL